MVDWNAKDYEGETLGAAIMRRFIVGMLGLVLGICLGDMQFGLIFAQHGL